MTNKQTDKQSDKQTDFADCLISKQAALDAIVKCTICDSAEELEEYVAQQNYWNGWAGGVLEALSAVEDVPSVEPEIIRCKDCENWIPGYITDNDDFIPPKCGKYQQMVGHSSDDYCSRAERRTDGV